MLQIHERFRRGFVLPPVKIVLIVGGRAANAIGKIRKRRLPIGDRGLVGHAFHLGRQIAVGGGAFELGNLFELKSMLRFDNVAMRALGLEKRQFDRFARIHGYALSGKIIRGPGVQHDLVVADGSDFLAITIHERTERRLIGKIDGGHGRVGDFSAAVVGQDVIRQIGEDGLRMIGAKGLHHGRFDCRLQQHPVGREVEVTVVGLVNRDAVIGQRWMQCCLKRLVALNACRFIVATAGDQNCVDTPFDAQHLLQGFRRSKRIERRLLRGPQTEAAQTIGWNDFADVQTPTADGFGFAPSGLSAGTSAACGRRRIISSNFIEPSGCCCGGPTCSCSASG